MRILLTASEVLGFAKTGGLADVVGSLPQALAERGHECAVILPLYRCARNAEPPPQPTGITFPVRVGDRTCLAHLWKGTLPGSTVPAYLIDQPEFFDRDDVREGRGLYQLTLPDGRKADYADNASRFIFFSRAVLESLPHLGFWPEVIHANDWQTGLVPVYLREVYRWHGEHALRARYQTIRTLFTIHNIAYQGLFWHWDMPLTGLDWRLFNSRQLEFYGQLNLLKAGIVFADLINTVSPTYAREIQTPYFGCGLQGVLTDRQKDLFGIVNGVDYHVWCPATDPHLEALYDAATLSDGKPRCKSALQRKFAIAERADAMLLGMVARLVNQKGLDILVPAARELLRGGVQFIVLGEGDARYQQLLGELREQFPGQMGLFLGFEEALAHQIEAGVDAFLMPSMFEPCGLNQMYSMKYGTPPVVRATGGLADTVVDCTPETLANNTATGFRFVAYSPEELIDTVLRAVDLHRRPNDWLRLQRAGMRQDWSWGRCASEYEKLYERLAERGA